MKLAVAVLTTDSREHYRTYAEPRPYFGTAPAALLQGFESLASEIDVHVVSCVQQPMAAEVRLAANIVHHALHVPKMGWLRTGYQGCVRAVRRLVRGLQPDLVHGQGTERECALSAVLSGFPNLITIHGNMRQLARLSHARPLSYPWLTARLESFVLPRTGGVCCNSEHTENLVKPLAKRTWRVPNAVNPLFLTEPSRPPASDIPVLVNVGTVLPNKGQVRILELLRQLHEQGFRFQMHFIGLLPQPDPYSELFVEQLAAAEARGYARHLGLKSVPELVRCLDAASAIIHTPQEESFGLAAAEGLARNLKLFGFQTGGLNDVAAGVEGVELLPVNDWTGLYEAVARWLKQGHPRPSSAAHEMCQRYHPAAVARRHLDIYREFLAASP